MSPSDSTAMLSGGKLVARKRGSFNIVHIVELDTITLVIRVPVTGWGGEMTPAVKDAMDSQVATMRLVRNKTKIPVPEIYAYDTSAENKIGAPYICMSFIPGKTVSEVWFEDPDSGTLTREELRLRILTSLAQTMAKFSGLTFDKIGSIREDASGSTVIGPVLDYIQQKDETYHVTASGPFDSTSAYLTATYVEDSVDDEFGRGARMVLDVAMACLPMDGSPPGFVLCAPDFNSQNIMADDEGNITALIDWDFAQTMPRHLGYSRYPGWITRDWDLLTYGWPVNSDVEDSPEALERYRAHDNTEMGKALNWEGDWKFTEKSHITEAIWIAAQNELPRLRICNKIVQTVVALYRLGRMRGDEDFDWDTFKATLKRWLGVDELD
ncbi:kinase-like domain-containing protein [Thelonectria olida]|uniref:Kinase-like domain-containing protein n=1 Tax=Thelonectria olida TaxID=1576542 RepID=A0A9P8W3E7_9HYPO|nr:kinase-like domain-containing protein [Thelonectria olida]